MARSWGRQLRQQWQSPLFQLKLVILLLLILITVGVSFYRLVLHWNLRDALLQIVLTISTLGGEANRGAHSPLAEWFDIFFVVTILIVALWGVTLLIEAMVRGELMYYWGRRGMEQRIGKLDRHYIICGFGRMGQEIARQFARSRQPFVVIEHNPAQLPHLEASGFLYVQGDAREDEQLLTAGIQRARGLIAVYATDEENVYITLSARVLNPDIHIVTRSSQESSEAKLRHAGATRVFSPYVIGGRQMAQAVLRPSVVEFLDTVVHGEQLELVLEEMTVTRSMPMCGRPLNGAPDTESLGVHLLGVATRDGQMRMRDLQAYCPQEGDTLILLGNPDAMQGALERLTRQEKV